MDVVTMDGRIRAQWSVVIVTDRAPGVGRCNGSPANLPRQGAGRSACKVSHITLQADRPARFLLFRDRSAAADFDRES